MRTALLLSLVVAAAWATSNPPSRCADITGIVAEEAALVMIRGSAVH
ncbi:MAG: hypothetical protein AAB295_00205 [Chloroflexota bacterium]